MDSQTRQPMTLCPHLPALLHTSPVMQHRCPSPSTLTAHSLLPLCQKVMLLHLSLRSVLKSHLLSGWTILSTMALPPLSSIPLSCFIFFFPVLITTKKSVSNVHLPYENEATWKDKSCSPESIRAAQSCSNTCRWIHIINITTGIIDYTMSLHKLGNLYPHTEYLL